MEIRKSVKACGLILFFIPALAMADYCADLDKAGFDPCKIVNSGCCEPMGYVIADPTSPLDGYIPMCQQENIRAFDLLTREEKQLARYKKLLLKCRKSKGSGKPTIETGQ